MSHPDDVPPFRGDLSPEDTKSWFETLIKATGSFSDSGIFRLLSTKFVEGSPASEWFDNLEDGAKTSWAIFQRQFRTKWIAAPLVKAQEDIKWAEFSDHRLAYERVFASEFPDPAASRDLVIAWANLHSRLGPMTNRKDSELIEKTESLLPAFIQAYLQVYLTLHYKDFKGLCSAIQDIPVEIYRFEWLRYQKSSKDTHLLEIRVGELSDKVDSILSAISDLRIGADAASRSQAKKSGNAEDLKNDEPESVAWEPSSPLTSVVSEDMTETGMAELFTPLAEPRALPAVGEDSDSEEDVILPVSRNWRKPISSLGTKDRVAIAEKAIDFILMFETAVSSNQASIVNSAISIFDRLVGRKGKERDSKAILPADKYPDSLWYSIEMMYQYRSLKHPLKLHHCRQEWSKFIPIDNVVNPSFGFVCIGNPSISASWNNSTVQVRYNGNLNFKPIEGAFYNFTTIPSYVEVRSSSTVLFMALSSYLAECTKDPGILKLAINCAICIRDRMLDSATMLIKDCNLDYIGNHNGSGTLSCHLTGIAIEGFNVLATVSGDAAWKRLASDITEAAMRARDWHGGDGILTVGTDDTPYIDKDPKVFKGLLSRGLLVAYQRNPADKALRNMIRSYINVQVSLNVIPFCSPADSIHI
ncbi:hypothetical protein FRC03_012782 [Tulasnella sp. 419]|nr:hypothetical protein FRC03_012782 [Tulasnella sp. 419]